jgi:FKBP-type peptidyl-prolyl cis-trans isomerase
MRHLFFLAIFFFGSAFAETSLNEQEKKSLSVFLRVLTEDSEAGYVLYDSKPICIHGYRVQDSFSVQSANHRESVALKEGAQVWKGLKKEKSDILIHISQKEDPEIPNCIHVLVINVPLFHRVINENLSLFQYVLGPSITSQDLLNALIIEGKPFHALLKYDKALIGILLGFGTQNSLYGSRVENLMENSLIRHPPFLSRDSIHQEFDQEYLPFPANHGFKTAQGELDAYWQDFAVSSENLQEKKPNFIFGWVKKDEKNKTLLSELENAQQKIQKLLKSENFERDLLGKIIGNSELLSSKHTDDSSGQAAPSKMDKQEVNRIVAKGLWEFLRHDHFDYLPYFIEGLDASDVQKPLVERLAYFSTYLHDFLEAQNNLKAASAYFEGMHDNREFHCMVPFKLYYKTIETAEASERSCKGSLVTVTYSLYSPQGHHLSSGHNKIINLKNTISGFAQAIQGMRIGETREIFIHPALSYGFDDKCRYLKAVVTLEDIHNEIRIPEMKALDLDFLFDPAVWQTRETHYKNGLTAKGAAIASHLRKHPEIDLAEVKNHLLAFYRTKQAFTSTSEAEQDVINHVHWTIYWSFAEKI